MFSFFESIQLLFAVLMSSSEGNAVNTYRVDDSGGFGHTFGGIGAISGGGATSKLLINYPEPQQSHILDYLFKPNFGASLQILKVEIGGDSQSTDGAEASHMHTATEANFYRGYEWWLMKEAKKRNPEIKLYGLPWVFPGWLGGGKFDPYSDRMALVMYIMNWIKGAKLEHNLTIDYIGIWNERPYDIEYIKMLRSELDAASFDNVKIVASDSASWAIVDDLAKDKELLDAVDIIGAHYPGTKSPPEALTLGRPIWASEEYSCQNSVAGGRCWARILNEGYVNGHLSATIAWNLIASYYDNLPYPRSSLMTANEPWSGFYEVSDSIWMTAHWTQFSAPGWHYLKHGAGVGNLTANGTYVTMVSPDKQHLTLVIETMDPDSTPCFYPMPKYTVGAQKATFTLDGSFNGITELNMWYSRLDPNDTEHVVFKRMPPIKVINNTFSLSLELNEIYTLTTLTTGVKGSHPTPPGPQNFPIPFTDDFEGYAENEEPFNLAQQAGVFEVLQSSDKKHGKIMVQTVPEPPVDTCRPEKMPGPISVIGNFSWTDVDVSMDFYLESGAGWSPSVFLAARVSGGGCWIMYSNGIFLSVFPDLKAIVLTGNYSGSVVYGMYSADIGYDAWYTLRMQVKGHQVSGFVDGKKVFSTNIPELSSPNGFVAIGNKLFAKAYFDNFSIQSANVTQSDVTETNTSKHGDDKNSDENSVLYNDEFIEKIALKKHRDKKNHDNEDDSKIWLENGRTSEIPGGPVTKRWLLEDLQLTPMLPAPGMYMSACWGCLFMISRDVVGAILGCCAQGQNHMHACVASCLPSSSDWWEWGQLLFRVV